MLTLNFDSATENTLKVLAQPQQKSIEQVLTEALQFYRDEEELENKELNELANTRLHDGQKYVLGSY